MGWGTKVKEDTVPDSHLKDVKKPQWWGQGRGLQAEPSSDPKAPELLAVLSDLEKQPEEGQEAAPSAKVKIKTHNQVICTILGPVQWSLNLIGPRFPFL